MKKQKEKAEQIQPPDSSGIAIEWEAPEYIQHEKSRKWYLAAGGAGLGCVIASILTDNLTMALAVIVFGAVYYYMQTGHTPKKIKIRISGMGIYVGEMFFTFGRIEAFWIIYQNGVKTLNLRVSKRYHSDVVIQLDGQDPAPVRDFLIRRIPEWEGRQESFGDIILRILKF